MRYLTLLLLLLITGCTTAQVEEKASDFYYNWVVSSSSPSQMAANATYMSNVIYTYYSADYEAKNAMGNLLKDGRPYYSAASDWSWFPVDTIFEINGKQYIIDDTEGKLIGSKILAFYIPNVSKEDMSKIGYSYGNIKILQWGSYEKSYKILKAIQDNSQIEEFFAKIP